jgi:hypothetical protein
MSLSLNAQDDKFVLGHSETADSITLTEDDILLLAQSLPALRDRILSQRSRPEAGVIVTTPVALVELANDPHQTEIWLTMIDGRGARIAFSLSLEVARALAERLPVRIARIEAAATARTRQ